MYLFAKYNTQTTFTFPMVKRGAVDLAVSGDWTPATGDTKVSKDAGNVANTTNNPAAIGGTGSALWSVTLTAAELSAAEVVVQIVDSATKAVEDNVLRIYTYGNASAKIPFDLSDTVRAGLTALPNAAAAANGGLPTVDATNSVKIQTPMKRNTALAKYKFVMTDSTNHNNTAGLTVSVSRQIDSATTFTSVGTATDAGNGAYHIDLASGDMNGAVILLRCTASGADDLFITLLTEP